MRKLDFVHGFFVGITALLVEKMKSPVRFRSREATRAAKAAEAAGLNVHSIECCPDGRVIVHTGKTPQAAPGNNNGIAKDAADVVAQRLR